MDYTTEVLTKLYASSLDTIASEVEKNDKLLDLVVERQITINYHKKREAQYNKLIIERDKEILTLNKKLVKTTTLAKTAQEKLQSTSTELIKALSLYKENINIGA